MTKQPKQQQEQNYYIKLDDFCIHLSYCYAKATAAHLKHGAFLVASDLGFKDCYLYTWDEAIDICREMVEQNLAIASSHDVWERPYSNFKKSPEIIYYEKDTQSRSAVGFTELYYKGNPSMWHTAGQSLLGSSGTISGWTVGTYADTSNLYKLYSI